MLRFLLLVEVLLTLAPARAQSGEGAVLRPPEQRVAKTEGSHDGGERIQAEGADQEASDGHPAAPQPAAPACDVVCQQQRENLDIERKLEWFTGGLLGVGLVQAGTFLWQAWILRGTLRRIEDQADIARRTLVAQFRPRLVVRKVRLVEKEICWTVEVHILNRGDTPAHLGKNFVTIDWTNPRDGLVDLVSRAAFDPITLAPGEEHWEKWCVDAIIERMEAARLRFRYPRGLDIPDRQLSCWGLLYYTDNNGAQRSTGFHRSYAIHERRFVASTDPEDEYAD